MVLKSIVPRNAVQCLALSQTTVPDGPPPGRDWLGGLPNCAIPAAWPSLLAALVGLAAARLATAIWTYSGRELISCIPYLQCVFLVFLIFLMSRLCRQAILVQRSQTVRWEHPARKQSAAGPYDRDACFRGRRSVETQPPGLSRATARPTTDAAQLATGIWT